MKKYPFSQQVNIMKNLYFAYRSFWPELETMKKFRECGIDTFCYMVSNTVNSLGEPYTKYPPVWKWNQVYDLSAFRRQTDDILNAVPDARLMCVIDLNTPHWWTRYLGAFGVRYDSFYELGKIAQAETWRNDTAAYLRVLLECAEKEYPDHIVAYILGAGGATEWHDRSRGEESVYRLAAWQRWRRRKGLLPVDIPGRLRRDHASHDFITGQTDCTSYYNGIDPTGCYEDLFPEGPGLLREPFHEQEVMDYWRFCNESNVESARFFLEESRKIIRPEVELGMFFGYGVGQWMLVSGGHLEYEKLLAVPELDFIMAPVSYVGRGMGHGTTSMTVHESIRINGKRMLQEMDQRTGTGNRRLADYIELPDPSQPAADQQEWSDHTDSRELAKKFVMAADGVWRSEDDIIAGMRRDTAYCLIHQDSLWWFDMWGGFYEGKAVFDNLKKMKELWDAESLATCDDVSDVLMVEDPENLYLLNDMDCRCGSFRRCALQALSRSGLAYSVASVANLERMDLKRFKLIVFCHPFRLREAYQKVFGGGRSVLWLYGHHQ